MSLESLRFMLGGAIHRPTTNEPVVVHHTEEVVCLANGIVPIPKDHSYKTAFDGTNAPAITASAQHPIRLINLTTGARTQLVTGTIDGTKAITFKNPSMISSDGNTQLTAQGDHIRIFWDEIISAEAGLNNETAIEVTISPSTFPGTYKVVGDTFMRSEKTGADEPFQFIIGKAKVASEVTITLEAEGDPSTFELTLNVLRSKNDTGDNEMMKLVRYNIAADNSQGSGNDIGSLGSM